MTFSVQSTEDGCEAGEVCIFREGIWKPSLGELIKASCTVTMSGYCMFGACAQSPFMPS